MQDIGASRAFRGSDDLVLMKRLVSTSWRLGRPHVNMTVGDLEWWTINDTEIVLADVARIWERGGHAIGWEWADPPGGVDWHTLPGEVLAPHFTSMLDRLEERAAATSDDPGLATKVWAMDSNDAALTLLAERGYAADGTSLTHWIRALPRSGGSPVEIPCLPAGYRRGHARWPDGVADRVEAHRAAFAPSRMTVAKYSLLAERPHYAPERDRVILAPDGSIAAFANAWWDPDGEVGELEPVGTRPEHRRLGLARAACLDAIAALAELGAREVLIFSDPSSAAAAALYASLGARPLTTSRRYARKVMR